MQAASAWSLGQIGRHTSDHARALAEVKLVVAYSTRPEASALQWLAKELGTEADHQKSIVKYNQYLLGKLKDG